MALTGRKEARMLAQYGHQLAGLSPTAIAQAAEADIATRLYNAEITRMLKNKTDYPPKSETRRQIPKRRGFAFYPRHVSRAGTAADIVRAALNDPPFSYISDRNRYLIYADRERLAEALELLEPRA